VQLPAGFVVHAVGFGDLHSAAEEITQYAADVVVLEPAELRELVIRGLTAVAESAAAA
jgi:proteasome accessory factor B